MAEVWVVSRCVWEDWTIEGVYDSLGAADAHVRDRVDVSGAWSAEDGRMYGVSGHPEDTWFVDRFEVRHG